MHSGHSPPVTSKGICLIGAGYCIVFVEKCIRRQPAGTVVCMLHVNLEYSRFALTRRFLKAIASAALASAAELDVVLLLGCPSGLTASVLSANGGRTSLRS